MRAGTLALCCAPAALAVLLACGCAFAAEEAPPAATASQPAGTAPEKPPEAVAQPLPAVARFRFAGNDHFSSRSLRRDLETRTAKPIVVNTLMADVDHIVARYADDGYLEAQVKATFEPLEGKARAGTPFHRHRRPALHAEETGDRRQHSLLNRGVAGAGGAGAGRLLLQRRLPERSETHLGALRRGRAPDDGGGAADRAAPGGERGFGAICHQGRSAGDAPGVFIPVG